MVIFFLQFFVMLLQGAFCQEKGPDYIWFTPLASCQSPWLSRRSTVDGIVLLWTVDCELWTVIGAIIWPNRPSVKIITGVLYLSARSKASYVRVSISSTEPGARTII